jgi:hypothetical protein
MQSIRTGIAIALLTSSVAVATAAAQTKSPPPQAAPRVIILDPNASRPPPVPHDRTYVGPGPTVVPPMERIAPVAPLAQPPIR